MIEKMADSTATRLARVICWFDALSVLLSASNVVAQLVSVGVDVKRWY